MAVDLVDIAAENANANVTKRLGLHHLRGGDAVAARR